MTRLLLVRHGVTDWNVAKKLQGQSDIPLNDFGRETLSKRRLPDRFSEFQLVSSPLKRTFETAVILNGKTPVTVPELIEMNWGEWEGQTIAQLRSKYVNTMTANEAKGLDMRPTGGETPREVQMRLQPWLQSMKADTIAVTHKGVIRALKSLAYDWDMKAKYKIQFDWTACHLFEVNKDGQISPIEVNIPMEEA